MTKSSLLLGGLLAISMYIVSAFGNELEAETSDLINRGLYKEARENVENAGPSEKELTESRIAKAQGNLKKAIIGLRRIVARDPSNIPALRELAHSFFLDDQTEAAISIWERLLRIDRNEAFHAPYRNFILQSRRKRLTDISFSFAILPSTNINRGSENLIINTSLGPFVIDEGSRAQSGVGFESSIAGRHLQPITPDLDFLVRWNLVTQRFPSESDLDVTTGLIGSGLRLRLPRAFVEAFPFVRRAVGSDRFPETTVGFNSRARFATGRAGRLDAFGVVERLDFEGRSGRDGSQLLTGLGYEHSITPRLSLRGGGRLQLFSARLQQNGFREISASAGGRYIFGGPTAFDLQLEVGRREAFGVFPLTDQRRLDEFASISSSVQFSGIRYFGFSPIVGCRHAITESNISLFEFDETGCNFRITRQF